MSTELQDEAENYFLQANYLNRRIIQDIKHVRESYEETWNQLDIKEKDQVINDEIILPEVVLKHGPSNRSETKSFPQLRIKSGQKIILDECDGEKIKYRDEHSAPFSWKTRSQADLNLELTCYDQPKEEGAELVAARRSAILSCPFKKIPKAAKPVSIPIVPNTGNTHRPTELMKQKSECDIYAPASVNQSISQPKSQKAGHQQQQKEQKQLSSDSKAADQQKEDCQNDPQHVESLEEVTNMASSIVISQQNSLVLDFSQPLDLESANSSLSIDSLTPREEAGGGGIINKMKERTMSLKRSLTPTMRRKKSVSSVDTGSMMLSMSSTDFSEVSPNKNKGARAVSCSRPTAPPPPPPPSASKTPPPPTCSATSIPLPSAASSSSPLPTAVHTGKSDSLLRRSAVGAMPGPVPPLSSPTQPPAPPVRDPQTRISCRDLSTCSPLPSHDAAAADDTSASERPSSLIDAAPADEAAEPAAATDRIIKTGFDFLDDW